MKHKSHHQIILLLIGTIVLWPFSYGNAAESPRFSFPLDCTLGKDCWSVNYVDVDPAEGSYADFACNRRTYDGHKGTDFALRSLSDVKNGVDVLAAKDGTIIRMRDGESDTVKSKEALEVIKEQTKECGNGVFIDHGGGLHTVYCHLKRHSLIVERGDKVKAGQKIAEVGHSGNTEFPHLHFSVVSGDGILDPYTGMLSTEGCGKNKKSLWAEGLNLQYESIALYDAGFSDHVPDFKRIRAGEANLGVPGPRSAAFVFWIGMYGVVEGDQFHIEVTDPHGKVFVQRLVRQEKTRARQYYYAGRKLTDRGLIQGTYTGLLRVTRSGREMGTLERTIQIR